MLAWRSYEVSQLLTPDKSSGLTKPKRQRKKFACSLCREKKLRCDRIQPICGRCQHLGTVCNYVSTPPFRNDFVLRELGKSSPVDFGSIPQRPDLPDGLFLGLHGPSVLDSNDVSPSTTRKCESEFEAPRPCLESRVNRNHEDEISQCLNCSPRSHHHLVPSPTVGIANQKNSETVLYLSHPSRPQFHGSSAAMSVISSTPIILKEFPAFDVFVSDPALRSQWLLQARAESIKLREEQAFAARSSSASLHHLLPSNEKIKLLVQVYWENMETTFRVLHQPSFEASLESLLKDRQGCREAFVATVLMVMATVRGLVSQTRYMTSSIERQNAAISCATWIEACAKWLSYQEPGRIESVQIRLLMCIAIKVNSSGSNRVWEEAKSLLYDSVSIGLHRNTATLSQSFSVENAAAGLAGLPHPTIAPFEAEMRRRLWSSIVELELQASFDRGLPSFAATISADCGAPNNLADEDLGTSTGQMPMSASMETYTRASFLRISHGSLSLRAELNRIINDSANNLSIRELLKYDEMIRQELHKLPNWAKSLLKSDAVSSSSVVAAMTLDIQLRQYLLPLHAPFIQQAGFHITHSYSRLVCANTACTILEYHSKLAASGNSCLHLMRDDVFRAALSLSHHMILWNALKCNFFTMHFDATISQFLERALEMLEDKVLRLGGSHRQVWFLTVSFEMFRTTRKPERIDFHLQSIVDRLTALLYKDLGWQDQFQQLKIEPGQNILPTTPDSMSETNSATVSTTENMSMVYLSYQEHEIRSWLLKNILNR